LPHILLFSILAIVAGANSYRGIRTFIRTHLKRLNKAFQIDWKRAPAHTAIRYILQGLDPADVETVFREHAANLNSSAVALLHPMSDRYRSRGMARRALLG
jgi:DDE_Tnp_1-associated